MTMQDHMSKIKAKYQLPKFSLPTLQGLHTNLPNPILIVLTTFNELSHLLKILRLKPKSTLILITRPLQVLKLSPHLYIEVGIISSPYVGLVVALICGKININNRKNFKL